MFPTPTFDPHSHKPLYRQLYEHMRGSIETGNLPPGSRLPATRELAGSLGVNRATVSAAYELLESEGLITGHVGRGSFVSDSLPKRQPLEEHLNTAGELISFASSRPAEQLFPIAEFRATVEEVVGGDGLRTILQLGSPYGYVPLRKYLLKEAIRQGLARDTDEVIVTSGCQQALDLIQRVVVPDGGTALIEDPVYPGIRNSLQRSSTRVVGIPVGPHGMDIHALERALAAERPGLVIVTSTFQNPTGATVPLENRMSMLAAVRRYGALLVENDLYSELRYTGSPVTPIRELDDRGEVILLRSFSKISFPGLRVGWILAPRVIAARLAEAKQWTDLHTDQLSQAVLLRFAESGRLERHKAKMLAAGAERLEAALAACAQFLPEGASFTQPEGGMNLWVRLPEPLDAGELLEQARRENVAYLPGRYFAVSRSDAGSLRISFAGLAPERIRQGIAVLGTLFSNELRRIRTEHRLETAPAMV